MPPKNNYNFVDLFSGIGGFHLGLKNAAKKSKAKVSGIIAVDNDQKARLTYSANFKKTEILNDITNPSVKERVPRDVDIICGGFPCQPFSQAGKKQGINDHRGALFMHIVDILREKKPKAVFLENVMNLMNIKNSDGSLTIETISKELERVGYPISIKKYRATDFGLPTHRPRIYMVGFRKDILPNKPDDSWWPKPAYEKPVNLDEFFENLDERWDTTDIERLGWPKSIGRTLRLGGIDSAYKSNEWLKKHGLPQGSYFRIDENKIWINDRRSWDSYLFFENDPKRKKPHKLTIDETKAMMGFPSDFEFPDQLSYHQKMKQIGNSVAIPVIEAIGAEIIRTINLSK